MRVRASMFTTVLSTAIVGAVGCSGGDNPLSPGEPALARDAAASARATVADVAAQTFALASIGAPGWCLSAGGGSTPRDGDRVTVAACTDIAAQRVTLGAAGELSVGAGLCLETTPKARVGDPLTVRACVRGAAPQRWTLTPALQVRSAVSERCVEAATTTRAGDALARLSDCRVTAGQQWEHVPLAPPPAPPTPVATITVTPSPVAVDVGAPQQLVAVARDTHGAALDGRAITWASSDTNVVTVSPAGLLQGRRAGRAAVTATSEGRTASAAVTVRNTAVAPPPAPSPPVSPQPAPSVAIYPGQSIPAAVDANPAGTTFLLKAGTHSRQTVVPKSGDVFVGEAGAVMDGDASAAYAFWTGPAAPYPSAVQIRGLVIQNYAPPPQMGAVRAGGHTPAEGARGWVVEGCEIRNNATGGVRLGDRMTLRRNNVHHNGQIGVVGIGDSVLVEDNEIAYNNHMKANDPGFEAGGTKFVQTRGLVVRGNFVHHNYGPGLWTDVDNINTLVEGNRVEDNADAGIFHEISYAAVIRNNTVSRNGFRAGAWLYGAGILVSASPNVEVYGNTVTDNYNGITAVQQNRGSGAYGPRVTQNLYVHDNQISMAVGRTGIGQDVGSALVFTSWNNRFQNNRYRLGGAARYFEWADGQRTEAEWRAYGQDAGAAFAR